MGRVQASTVRIGFETERFPLVFENKQSLVIRDLSEKRERENMAQRTGGKLLPYGDS